MRRWEVINHDWIFIDENQKQIPVNLPHTWNSIDGQDGGNDYKRGTRTYLKSFAMPKFDPKTQCVYLQFEGVNASAEVTLNGVKLGGHDGGYSTFRFPITEQLMDQNELVVSVDNSVNEKVYPQKADFTFYGGIYRDVSLLVVNKNHFALDSYGTTGIKVTPILIGDDGDITIETEYSASDCHGTIAIFTKEGELVGEQKGASGKFTIENVHKWNGVKDPYLYTAVATLYQGDTVVDEVTARFGVRSFSTDPKKGFFLNGKPFPLRGVSRHQDFKGLGNALSKDLHKEDMDIIKEMGANTVRLAHYQHDQYIYDLCDEYGFVVWAEIPYISEHMNAGRENTYSQMKELITQNYNHASIVCWGLSNEITISTKDKKDMLDNHHKLNELCHEMDPTRFTTVACYAMCAPWNKSAHISDVVSWNLYLGWYVPGLWLNDVWMGLFHTLYPKRCLGYSEYGCEAMPNLHSSKPKRNDHTEEYQAVYHEYMLKCFERHPYLWATHVWNMFDFAADARNQGGEPGMNHKGLVTFDRKVRKDSFYLYKAYWSDEAFVHLCGSRYVNRAEKVTEVKVYSNQKSVKLYQNGKLVGEQSGNKVFSFRVTLEASNEMKVVAGDLEDTSVIRKVNQPDPSYTLKQEKTKSNWV